MPRLFDLISQTLIAKKNRRRALSTPRRKRRAVTLETLENRQLLANDLAVLSDEFDDAASISQWQRVNEVEGWNADQLETWSIDADTPGAMLMSPHTVVWYEDYRGPMAFQEVTGDFVITTEVTITDRDDIGNSDPDDVPGDGTYSLGGLMIRTPREISTPADWAPGSQMDDGTNNGENYVFLSLGHGGGDQQFSIEVKTTRNSHSDLELTPLGQTANQATMQIARIGDSVITLLRFPGESWQVHRRYSRADMPETLQVGFVTYSDYGKASDFDPLFHNGNVLDGSVDPTPETPFNRDLQASFDYARFFRPEVPAELLGQDLSISGSDEQLLAFLGENANAPAGEEGFPEIPDQAVLHDQALEILLAETHNGLTLGYEVELVGDELNELDQDHNLFSGGDYFENWAGQDERWIQGDGGWYFLTPNGDFRLWNGAFETSELLGQLGAEVYEQPALLHDSQLPADVALNGNTITVTPQASYTGVFEVLVTISDGESNEVQSVSIDVFNNTPTIAPIVEQFMAATEDSIAIDYFANDPDGDALMISAAIQESAEYELDQAYGFQSAADYFDNWGGQSERWIQDAAGDWFFLLPTGSLNRWEGDFGSSVEIAALDVSVYDDPSRLTDAEGTPVDVSIQAGQIVVDPADGFAGQTTVVVTASDGIDGATIEFVLNVVNSDPVISPIADQMMGLEQPSIDVPVVVNDVDGDAVEVSVQVLDPAYDLDQQLGLWSDGEFYENWGGESERWLRDADDQWHYLLPSGAFYRWEGSFESSTLVAELDARYYQDPLLLADAQPLAASASILDGVITIERDLSLTGQIQVRVAATDGIAEVTQLFTVVIS